MEQRKRRTACTSTEPEPSPGISIGKFFKEITIDLWDRFALIFFILNTLHLLKNGGYWYCYCKQRKSEQKDFCQIWKIPDIFYGFESFVDKHRFDILALRKYYFRLKNELIKRFYDSPRSTQAFLGVATLLRWSRLEHRRILKSFSFRKHMIFRINFFVKKLEIKKGQKNIVLFDDLIQRGRFFLNLP